VIEPASLRGAGFSFVAFRGFLEIKKAPKVYKKGLTRVTDSLPWRRYE